MKLDDRFEVDTMPTSTGELEIVFIGHGSLMMRHGGQTIHIDPFSRVADYGALPKADLILITHEHRDHLDPEALQFVQRDDTVVVMSESCVGQLPRGTVMRNGDATRVGGMGIEAVPAYNIANKRPDGQPFHPPGRGNGYVLTFGDLRVYVAGDTENIPEMGDLKEIDIAFLPMNLPYTMTPEMVAAAVKAFKPKILYPYHFGSTDTARLEELLAGYSDIEIRIRKMA